MTTGLALHLIDKTLPNFIKRKHPTKGEKKKQEVNMKMQTI
jgi:hypothetical protein